MQLPSTTLCRSDRSAQVLCVHEGHVAGEGEVEAAVDAGPRELGVPGEAVQDGVLGGAVGVEDLEDVAVGLAVVDLQRQLQLLGQRDRKSTRLNSSHVAISYAVFCLK